MSRTSDRITTRLRLRLGIGTDIDINIALALDPRTLDTMGAVQ